MADTDAPQLVGGDQDATEPAVDHVGGDRVLFAGSFGSSVKRQYGPDALDAGQPEIIERLIAEHERLSDENRRLRGLIGRSIRVIELQNEKLESRGLERVESAAEGTIDLRHYGM